MAEEEELELEDDGDLPIAMPPPGVADNSTPCAFSSSGWSLPLSSACTGSGFDFAHSPPCDHKVPGLAFRPRRAAVPRG
jgi:hypothetical protein